ncbi:bacterial translation initiation factor 3 (bIF-3) [Jannaschia faecimaris]|uniref:Translation initiation factor IF-3 n=1 Tax=Jannaschia faecimaris TaxID=1244108 RepID=A0A1H3RN68_9RHOB|nr:bacterial translation initiation factor 3 (bIF-3) [Jannaschia faecimaris]
MPRRNPCPKPLLPAVTALKTVRLGAKLLSDINVPERTTTIARRPHNAPPQRDTGPRVNDRIRAVEIRLIGAEGENVGVVSPARARQMAEDAGLDLVEISPNAVPPVCKIMDFGKFKYETQKKEAEARKRQKTIEIKEVKFRPNTDTNDYDVKMRNVFRFLEDGDKVKITLRFRGREMAHQNLGRELLERVSEDTKEVGKVENFPKMEGRQMVMMIGPIQR